MPTADAPTSAETSSFARSRRVIAVVAIAGITVLITLAAALVIAGLDWFVAQGWAIRALAIAGVVAWPRLGRMGRIGAATFAAGVAVYSGMELALMVAPEVGTIGALNGLAIPCFLVVAAGFFILVFGALRSLRGPWWLSLSVAGGLAVLTGVSIAGTDPGLTLELAVNQAVAQGYILVSTIVAVIAAIIDGVRMRRHRSPKYPLGYT